MLIMNRLHNETWREALARQRDASAVASFDEMVSRGVRPKVAAMLAAVASI